VRRRTGPRGLQGGVSRWWVALSLLAGVVLVVVAVLGLSRDRSTPSSFGAAGPINAPSPTGAPAVLRPPSHPTPAAGAPAAPAALAGGVLAVPVRLGLLNLGVRATVQGVVTTGGVLGVPDDPARVGWWTGSVRPGSSAGSTVLDGHVDSAVSGAGALFRLAELSAGDLLSVTDARGRDWTYRVYGRQVYAKHQGLPPALFSTTGPARLVLITCGGPFNAAARSYQDNIVVFASPKL
jgi:hypothetical protein